MSVIVAFTFAITLWYSYYHKVTLSNRLRPFQRSAPTMLALVNWGVHLIPLQPVHFKVIRVVHFILIRPVHLKVIWTVHLKCRNQGILADKWRPYMENLDTMYTDATCYESEMRYPTDAKLLWEGVEKSYATMCELSSRLGIHRPQTKFLDVQKADLTYRKQQAQQ